MSLYGIAGHAVYGIAPFFGHTGMLRKIDLVLAAFEVILRPPEAVFLD